MKNVGSGKLSGVLSAFGGITYEKIDLCSQKGKKNRYL